MGLYKTNKQAKTGTIIECPVCHKKFKKIQYSQAFCCGHCKDKYHNRHRYNNYDNRYPFSYDGADNDQWGDCEFGIHD